MTHISNDERQAVDDRRFLLVIPIGNRLIIHKVDYSYTLKLVTESCDGVWISEAADFCQVSLVGSSASVFTRSLEQILVVRVK